MCIMGVPQMVLYKIIIYMQQQKVKQSSEDNLVKKFIHLNVFSFLRQKKLTAINYGSKQSPIRWYGNYEKSLSKKFGRSAVISWKFLRLDRSWERRDRTSFMHCNFILGNIMNNKWLHPSCEHAQFLRRTSWLLRRWNNFFHNLNWKCQFDY